MKDAKRKFLIVKMSAMGDVVHTLPALRSLRKKYPDAFIAWVVEDRGPDFAVFRFRKHQATDTVAALQGGPGEQGGDVSG